MWAQVLRNGPYELPGNPLWIGVELVGIEPAAS
jgi:hypothetical protein